MKRQNTESSGKSDGVPLPNQPQYPRLLTGACGRADVCVCGCGVCGGRGMLALAAVTSQVAGLRPSLPRLLALQQRRGGGHGWAAGCMSVDWYGGWGATGGGVGGAFTPDAAGVHSPGPRARTRGRCEGVSVVPALVEQCSSAAEGGQRAGRHEGWSYRSGGSSSGRRTERYSPQPTTRNLRQASVRLCPPRCWRFRPNA